MAGFKIVDWNMEEFRRIRNSEGITELFARNGEEWTQRLNDELHEAQVKRGQPVEDGYRYDITHGSRTRLYIAAATARAMAHEARHQSILKELRVGAKSFEAAVDLNLPEELAARSNEGRIHLDIHTGENRTRSARRRKRRANRNKRSDGTTNLD